jgi:hypothetical protein
MLEKSYAAPTCRGAIVFPMGHVKAAAVRKYHMNSHQNIFGRGLRKAEMIKSASPNGHAKRDKTVAKAASVQKIPGNQALTHHPKVVINQKITINQRRPSAHSSNED